MSYQVIENFLVSQELSYRRVLDGDEYFFKMVKLPEYKLQLVTSFCLKKGWYLIDAGRDLDDSSYVYLDIRQAKTLKVKIIINSDGSYHWYRTGSIFKVKISSRFKDTYEVIEPISEKGKTILKNHTEVVELL